MERRAGQRPTRSASHPVSVPPGQRLHFDDRLLSAIPPAALIATISNVAADLRGDLVVLGQTPEQAYVQLQGMHYIAVTDAEPPHRLTGLRGIRSAAGSTIPGQALGARHLAGRPDRGGRAELHPCVSATNLFAPALSLLVLLAAALLITRRDT
jgi:hypothetical protein